MKLVVGLGNPGAAYLMTRHNIGFMLADVMAGTAAHLMSQHKSSLPAGAMAGGNLFKKNCKSLVRKQSFALKPKTLKEPKGILKEAGQNPASGKQSGRGSESAILERDFLVAKPQTYMNLSGEAVAALAAFYKIPLRHILIVQDDVDQEFRKLKFQKNRGAGGHKGIQSIHDCLKTADYARLKLGVGRPLPPSDSLGLGSLFQGRKRESGVNTPASGRAPSVSDYVLSPFSDKDIPHLKEFLTEAAEAVFFFLERGFERAAGKYNGKSRF